MPEDNNKAVGPRQNGKDRAWWAPAMFIFFRTTAWIAAPIVIALYVGDYLEKKFGTGTHLLLITVAVAFIATIAGLIRTATIEFKKMDKKK